MNWRFVPFILFACVPATLLAQSDVTLDNTEASFEGEWLTGASARDRFGSDYRHTLTVKDQTSTAKAVFRPNLRAAGKYDVAVMYPQGTNRSTNAPYVIFYKGGAVTNRVNQQTEGGSWVTIARGLDFDSGTKGYVELRNDTSDLESTKFGRTMVIADGVRFTLIGSGSPAPWAASGAASDSAEISIHINGDGSVEKTPSGPGYKAGTVVTLNAIPGDGHVFAGWTGSAETMQNPVKIVAGKGLQLTAKFVSGAIGVVIDNEDPEVEYGGWKGQETWALSKQKYPGMRDGSHRFVRALNGKSDASATYRPNLPVAGKYDVYIWYSQGENRTTTAPWTIVYQGGEVKKVVNQQINGGGWFRIANDLPFPAGQGGYVMVQNGCSDEKSGLVVVADAVAFVYTGK